MNDRIDAIIEEARALTPAERETLLLRLHHEFGFDANWSDDTDPAEGTQEEIDAAWRIEIERRIDAFERGETTSRPWADVMADVRKQFINR